LGKKEKKRFKEEISECEVTMEILRDKRDEVSVARFQEAQLQHAKALIQEEAFGNKGPKCIGSKNAILIQNSFICLHLLDRW
jgi:hypothetical protein